MSSNGNVVPANRLDDLTRTDPDKSRRLRELFSELESKDLAELLDKVAQLPDPMPDVFPPLEEKG